MSKTKEKIVVKRQIVMEREVAIALDIEAAKRQISRSETVEAILRKHLGVKSQKIEQVA